MTSQVTVGEVRELARCGIHGSRLTPNQDILMTPESRVSRLATSSRLLEVPIVGRRYVHSEATHCIRESVSTEIKQDWPIVLLYCIVARNDRQETFLSYSLNCSFSGSIYLGSYLGVYNQRIS